MDINESRIDRIIRVIVGIILGILASRHLGGAIGTWVLGVIAAIALITGVSGRCGIYRLFGIRTCPVPIATHPSEHS